jgi:glycosyltransferase involved in cell wall biosynthesis
MPVYWADRPDWVQAAFSSITESQELPPDQVVLVRDGPVGPALGELLHSLAELKEVSLVALPRNGGLTRALNAGLAACRFDTVARQDADDVSTPERFGLTVPLVRSGEFDLVGSAVREFDDSPDGEIVYGQVRSYPAQEEQIRRAAKRMNPIAHPTVVFRRSQVLSVGGYRDIFHMEDYDLWVRLLQAGARAINVPEPLVDYRVSTAGLRRRGGWKTLRAESAFQRSLLESGFINRPERLRNLIGRGALELAPPAVLRQVLKRTWR